jgi:hypothetical protein
MSEVPKTLKLVGVLDGDTDEPPGIISIVEMENDAHRMILDRYADKAVRIEFIEATWEVTNDPDTVGGLADPDDEPRIIAGLDQARAHVAGTGGWVAAGTVNYIEVWDE